MSTSTSAGMRLRQAMEAENPLQIVGTLNALHALLATEAGFRAIYLSGGGLSAGTLGLPDLGLITLQDVLTEVERITYVTDTPLLVDVDTGLGPSAFNIARTVKSLIRAGAAGLHIEDQTGSKRCGHRPGKELVSPEEMIDRIKAAVDARTDSHFVIGARTDALASEGPEGAINRALQYQQAGADFLFAEGVTNLEIYHQFVQALHIPVLANITEFGVTPMFTREELANVGVRMILYPLSAFRAANKAALEVYQHIRKQGTQRDMLSRMQTREELYRTIGYYAYEQKLDALFHTKKSSL